VLLSGDAGVGKTRLLAALGEYVVSQGALVLTGRCLDAGETGLAYLPFAEALAGVSDRERALRGHPAVATLFPDAALPARPDPAVFGGLALQSSGAVGRGGTAPRPRGRRQRGGELPGGLSRLQQGALSPRGVGLPRLPAALPGLAPGR